MMGEITRNDAADRTRANDNNIVGFLRHQRVSLSPPWYCSISNPSWRAAIAPPEAMVGIDLWKSLGVVDEGSDLSP
jgi:hypothetical protein